MNRHTTFPALLAGLCAAALLLTACTAEISDAPSAGELSSASAVEESSESAESETSEFAFAPTYNTVVSIGKSYTASAQPALSYPDTNGKELTDGLTVNTEYPDYTDDKWCAYSEGSLVQYVLDLGKDSSRLYRFGISSFSDPSTAIAYFSTGLVYSSDDGENWTRLGVVEKPEGAVSSKMAGVAWLTLDAPIDARYIRFSVGRGSGWLFLDELYVVADVAGDSDLSAAADRITSLYAESSLTSAQIISDLTARKTGETNRERLLQKYSVGTHYTVSQKILSDFSTSNQALTDNYTVGSSYDSGFYIGFSAVNPLDITLDLAEDTAEISRFSISCYAARTLHVVLPNYVDFSVSDNGTDFVTAGRVYAPVTETLTNYTFTLSLPFDIHARYVRFSLPAGNEEMIFLIEEAEVFGYPETWESGVSYYDETPLKPASEAVYFPQESDWTTKQNLLQGLGQRIFMGYPASLQASDFNTDEFSTILTDGVKASGKDDIEACFSVYSGKTRDIVYDLGALASIESCTFSCILNSSRALYAPSILTLYLSENGTDWYRIETRRLGKSAASGVSVETFTPAQACKARFVRYELEFDTRVMIDELEAFGTKSTENSASLADSDYLCVKFGDVGYRTPDAETLGGASDIILLYYYDYKASLDKSCGYSYDDFLSYAGYRAADGTISDTMFNGFLFMASGTGKNGGSATGGTDFESASLMAEYAFTEGLNLDALNRAVGEIKQQTGKSDYKAAYYLTICIPTKGVNYGDLDGDGVSDTLATNADCIRAAAMQIDAYMDMVNRHPYENLTFGGFYWFDESVSEYPTFAEVITATGEKAESYATQLFWIPFNNATGYTAWANMGFDVCCLQPGYAFSADAKIDRIFYVAELAKRLNMCVEFELSTKALYDESYYDRYAQYLINADRYGYDKAIHIYFQSYNIFRDAALSDNPVTRRLYDYTYQMIHGTLQVHPDARADLSMTAKSDEATVFSLGDSEAGMVSYTVASMPSHGSVTIAPDGSLTYYPDHGYTGTDSFSYTYSRGLGESAECSVQVTVA